MADILALQRLIGRLRLRHLELLDMLGRDANLGRAATRMHMAQPTASKLLREIEDIFGTALFTRNRRGLEPTAAGIAMTRRATIVLGEMRAMHEEYLGVSRGATGRLRLGVFPVAVPELVPALLLNLEEQWPGLVVSVDEGAEYTLLAALSAGQLDCILGRVVAERLTPDLSHEVLYHEPTVIVSGARHPVVRARKAQRLPLLSSSPWLLPSVNGAAYNMVASRLALAGLPAPHVAIETISVFVTVELLSSNTMLSVLPMKIAQSYAKAGKLGIVPISLQASLYPVGIMFRRDAITNPLIRAVIEVMRAAKPA